MRGSRNQKNWTGALAAACLALAIALPALAQASPTLDRIKATGKITLAFRNNAAPISFRDRDGTVRGYAVELCTRVVANIQQALGLPKIDIEWLPVEAGNRLAVIAQGKADITCGNTTITLSRMEQVDFSLPIFVDGGSMLVSTDSKLQRFADFNGRKIAVIPATTTEPSLRKALSTAAVSATLVPVKDNVEGVALLSAGKVDGFAGDRLVLITTAERYEVGAKLRLLVDDFSYEPYGLVVRRDDPDFRLAVNRGLVALYRSGDIDAIFYRWLGSLGRPGPLLNSMFYLNTLPE